MYKGKVTSCLVTVKQLVKFLQRMKRAFTLVNCLLKHNYRIYETSFFIKRYEIGRFKELGLNTIF